MSNMKKMSDAVNKIEAYKKGEVTMTEYFEFNSHEYYALVAVTDAVPAIEHSFTQYVKHVGGDNEEMIKEEGWPDQINREDALIKFIRASGNDGFTTNELKEQFNRVENGVLLIDGNLL